MSEYDDKALDSVVEALNRNGPTVEYAWPTEVKAAPPPPPPQAPVPYAYSMGMETKLLEFKHGNHDQSEHGREHAAPDQPAADKPSGGASSSDSGGGAGSVKPVSIPDEWGKRSFSARDAAARATGMRGGFADADQRGGRGGANSAISFSGAAAGNRSYAEVAASQGDEPRAKWHLHAAQAFEKAAAAEALAQEGKGTPEQREEAAQLLEAVASVAKQAGIGKYGDIDPASNMNNIAKNLRARANDPNWKPPKKEAAAGEAEGAALSAIGGAISGLFGGGKKD